MQRLERVARRDHAVDHPLGHRRINIRHRHVDRVRAQRLQHREQFGGRAQPQPAQVGQIAHLPVGRDDPGERAALDRQHLQSMQFMADLRVGRGDAAIEFQLRVDAVRSAVETGLDADQMGAAAHIDGRDEADIGHAMAQFLHRHVRRQQRARPDRPNADAPLRLLFDKFHPCLVRLAERMVRAVGRRISQFGHAGR